MAQDNAKPIFIHSLFRSGSTYLFNVFRRSEAGYWCYQEPLNEYLSYASTEPDRLLEIHENAAAFLNHPVLEKPYFYEFYVIADEVGRFFHKEFSYDAYFSPDTTGSADLKTYFEDLTTQAQGRPVFQCCRSIGRVEPIKSALGGDHIFLWRNPWDQWWSHKIGFDTNNLLILNAKNLPGFLSEIKHRLQIPEFHASNIFEEYNFFKDRWLDSSGSYTLFYALWCYAMLEALPKCEITINIDSLSLSINYRARCLETFYAQGINGLEFSDCKIPSGMYGKQDIDFFKEVEDSVHDIFLKNGYTSAQIEEIQNLRSQHNPAARDTNSIAKAATRDAIRSRALARKFETEAAASFRQNLAKETQIQTQEQERQQLEAILEQRHEQLEQLQTTLYESGESGQQLEQLQAVLHESQQHRQQLETILDQRHEQLEQLRADLHESQQHQADLHESQQHRQQLEAILEQRHEQLEQLETALHESGKSGQQLTVQLQTQAEERQRLKDRLQTKEEDRQQLIAQSQKSEAERQRLNAQLQTKEAERQQLIAQLQTQAEERQQLIAQSQKSEAERQQLIAQLQTQAEERQQLIAQYHKLAVDIESLLNSRSIKMMAPFRAVGNLLRRFKQRAYLLMGKSNRVKQPENLEAFEVSPNHYFQGNGVAVSNDTTPTHPAQEANIAVSNDTTPSQPVKEDDTAVFNDTTPSQHVQEDDIAVSEQNLSPRQAQILYDLKRILADPKKDIER